KLEHENGPFINLRKSRNRLFDAARHRFFHGVRDRQGHFKQVQSPLCFSLGTFSHLSVMDDRQAKCRQDENHQPPRTSHSWSSSVTPENPELAHSQPLFSLVFS